MPKLIGSLATPWQRLRKWFNRSQASTKLTYEQADFSLSLASDTVPLAMLPSDTDEVLAGYKEAQAEIGRILYACGCKVAKVEIRRRLSVREYRAYINITTSMGIERLYEMEPVVRNKVLREYRIEIRDFFWSFTPDKALAEA